jgi:hypothetical protein
MVRRARVRRSYGTLALKVLGIRDRRPDDMRHTDATAMLMAGMTPAFCARGTRSQRRDVPANLRQLGEAYLRGLRARLCVSEAQLERFLQSGALTRLDDSLSGRQLSSAARWG